MLRVRASKLVTFACLYCKAMQNSSFSKEKKDVPTAEHPVENMLSAECLHCNKRISRVAHFSKTTNSILKPLCFSFCFFLQQKREKITTVLGGGRRSWPRTVWSFCTVHCCTAQYVRVAKMRKIAGLRGKEIPLCPSRTVDSPYSESSAGTRDNSTLRGPPNLEG